MVGARRAGVAMLLLVSVALAACSKRESPALRSLPDSLKWYGTYVSDTLPSAGGLLTQVAQFTIGPDTQARLAIQFGHRGTIFKNGVWWAQGSALSFEPRNADGGPLENAFVWRLEGARLVPVTFDAELYGTVGIPLTKLTPAPAPPADTAAGVPR